MILLPYRNCFYDRILKFCGSKIDSLVFGKLVKKNVLLKEKKLPFKKFFDFGIWLVLPKKKKNYRVKDSFFGI